VKQPVSVNDKRARARASRDHPGVQVTVKDDRLNTWLFRLFFLVILAAIFQSVVKANIETCSRALCWFWQLKLFDSSDGLTLLVALGALFYTRQQVIEGFRPHVVYEGSGEHRAGTPLARSTSDKTFHIEIKNTGSGTAIVQDIRYHLAVDGNVYFDLSYDEVLDQLEAFGLKPEVDFMLRKISPGYGIAKGGDLLGFEILRSKWRAIKWLDCELDFRGAAGPLYRKEIFLIPRDRDKRFPDENTPTKINGVRLD
jgi:hypothetical protein